MYHTTVDFSFWILDAGRLTLVAGCWTLDASRRLLHYIFAGHFCLPTFFLAYFLLFPCLLPLPTAAAY